MESLNILNYYDLQPIEQRGYGTYRVVIRDCNGRDWVHVTHEVELIESYRTAAGVMWHDASCEYVQAKADLVGHVVARLGLSEDGLN